LLALAVVKPLSGYLHLDLRGLVERMLKAAEIEVIPFGSMHYEAAVSAWLRYGKGRHPASLNLGDCFSYAVAQLSGQPLLCVGEGFKKTDLRLVSLD